MRTFTNRFLSWIVIFPLSLFVNLVFCQPKSVSDQKELILEEFSKKLLDPQYEMGLTSEKSFQAAKKIILFPKDLDQEKIILSHPEDIFFLTSSPHFIHKHVLVCTFYHNNDIRLTYDPIKDDFFFHTKESVKEMRALAEADPNLVYELDYYALRHKKRDPNAVIDHPSFIIFEMATTLHPSFKRKGDGHYYVEIASGSRENKPTASGNHNWLRLIDSEGNVISVGMHPKISMTQTNAFARIPIRFYNSDVYEWIDGRTYYSHTFPLHPSEYFALKQDIINDMIAITDKETSFDYHVLDYNCVHWISAKLKNIFTFREEEMKFDLYAAMFPELLDYYRKRASDEMKMILDPILRLIQYGVHLPGIIRAAICGGYVINEENAHSISFMSASWRIFDIDMHVALHPYLFEEYFQNHEKELMLQRVERISSIEKSEKNSEVIYNENEQKIAIP